MENKIPQVACTDCGKQITTKIAMKTAQIGVHRCEECQRTYNDNLYLDNGAVQVIREGADRRKRQGAVDLHELETDLDKLLEEY